MKQAMQVQITGTHRNAQEHMNSTLKIYCHKTHKTHKKSHNRTQNIITTFEPYMLMTAQLESTITKVQKGVSHTNDLKCKKAVITSLTLVQFYLLKISHHFFAMIDTKKCSNLFVLFLGFSAKYETRSPTDENKIPSASPEKKKNLGHNFWGSKALFLLSPD